MNRWQMQQLLGLLDEQSYRTADSLAEMLGVSEKTTRSRLKELDENLKACGAAIEAKPRYGYRLQIMDEEAYRRWSVSDGEAAAIPETMQSGCGICCNFCCDRMAMCTENWVH